MPASLERDLSNVPPDHRRRHRPARRAFRQRKPYRHIHRDRAGLEPIIRTRSHNLVVLRVRPCLTVTFCVVSMSACHPHEAATPARGGTGAATVTAEPLSAAEAVRLRRVAGHAAAGHRCVRANTITIRGPSRTEQPPPAICLTIGVPVEFDLQGHNWLDLQYAPSKRVRVRVVRQSADVVVAQLTAIHRGTALLLVRFHMGGPSGPDTGYLSQLRAT